MSSLRLLRCVSSLVAMLLPTITTSSPTTVEGIEPSHISQMCGEFGETRSSAASWTYPDCAKVWMTFAGNAGEKRVRKSPGIDIWRETANKLRRIGCPCLLAGDPPHDGIGSSTIRIIFSWIFAEEMGCEWITPDWGKKAVGNGGGEVIYCHTVLPTEKLKGLPGSELQPLRRCLVVNLLEFFNFGIVSVDLPQNVTLKTVKMKTVGDVQQLAQAEEDIRSMASMSFPWDRVLIPVGITVPTTNLACLGSWDTSRMKTVQNVLQKARDNFHQFPRPWNDKEPICDFDSTRLNFAVHARMGDRRSIETNELNYLKKVEDLMSTITNVVVERRMKPPMFHVFSETTRTCPDPDSGLFEEFPTWPVDINQTLMCLASEISGDCGEDCGSNKKAMFYIQDKPIALHLNPDIRNALSCMIKADGVVMGCSTFGQIAGVLSKGISFFSMECAGEMTGPKSRMTPGFALAERGHRWVPISGSWFDPVLYSIDILRAAIEEYFAGGSSLP